MNVHPGLLAASAEALAMQSQAVLAAQNAAAKSIDAAMFGWVGSSQEALTATVQRWAALSAGLNLRIHQHSEALRVSAMTFAEMDSNHALRLSGFRSPEPR